MVVLGIVLIVLAVLFGLGVSVSSGASTKMEVFGVDFGVGVTTVFFLGAAVGIAAAVGLWLTKLGLGRGWRRRKEVRELRQRAAAGPEAVEPAPTGDTAVDTTGDTARDTGPDSGRDSEAEPTAEADDEPRIVADGTETKQPH
ncbi:hypothetical protein EV643_104335 [Kribbella sp. VKM Ac-2527]|uniref:Uncharacterized protein n=1 Tax=Kribbella caucasensis TaxID=2512215 RepID=A0A4R6KNB3_9ACTN|nr:hypothetical protein [Kribbella sp. VKM Ac-2527]TDO50835.1 hypothetical protein EV643_104335 [Kribbella sp. VKM Ac-2527]